MTVRAFLLFVALSAPALAYLDPVTGNIVVQVVLGAFAAIAVGYHNFKDRVQLMFAKKKKKPARESEASQAKSASEGEKPSDESEPSPDATPTSSPT